MRLPEIIAAVCLAVLLATAPADAAVQTLDATATAQVEQTLPSGQVNTDLAIQTLGESTGNLPLLAQARLTDAGVADSGCAVNTRLADPRAAQTSDPAELGIAVLSNSSTANSKWSAFGTAEETRTVAFTAAEMGSDTGTALAARSYFYLDGILVLWRQAGSVDLTGTTAQVTVRVDQTRSGSASPATVLTTGMSFVGQADGTGTLTTSGPLVPENTVQLDVTDLVTAMGTVQVVVLPTLAIPYDYAAAVDETFTIKATLDGRITSGPASGAAVLLGASAEDVVSLVTEVAGQDVGQTLGQVLGTVIKQSPAAARPLTADDLSTQVTVNPQARLLIGSSTNLCGTLGAESAAALACFAGLIGLGATRRLRG